MTVRLTKIVLVLSLGLFVMLVAINNISDYDSNYRFVMHVLSMDTTFPDNKLKWRAITDPTAWHAAYMLIIACELTVCLLLMAGALALWRARTAGANGFHNAKKLAIIGCALGFVLWFVGFMCIGGEWFVMWQSPQWNGQQAAFRICACILGTLLLLQSPDAEPPGLTASTRPQGDTPHRSR